MKTLRTVAVLFALLLAGAPAVAQWQTPNHSVPIGRGGGAIGFGSAVPGAAGQPLISSGLTLDPAFGQAANNGIAAGAADTYKGSLNGTATTDVAMPSCTALGTALRYATGVGPNCGTVVGLTGFDMPINLGLSALASSNALTLTVTQANGSAPTAANPVVVPFRSTTLTSGAVSLGTISSTISITIPSGATLGTSSSNVPFRVWIFLDANGGTPALGVATCSNVTTIFPCVAWESTLKTSTTISAAAGSAGTLYAGTGVVSDAVRIVGYCDYSSGLATAGTWASSCTTLQVVGPGVKKPGDVVQTVFLNSSTPSQSITPTSAPNLIRVIYSGTYTSGSAVPNVAITFKRGATTIGTSQTAISNQSGTTLIAIPFGPILDAPGSAAAQTYSVTLGGTASTTVGLMTLDEIQG